MKYIDKINKENYFYKVDWHAVCTERFWYKDEIIITYFFNAFSLVIPDTEKFILTSLRSYKDTLLDADLSARLKSFFLEEGAHSLQHRRFNEYLKRHAYPIDFIYKLLRYNYKIINYCFTKKTKLAISLCFEHFTLSISGAFFNKELLEPGYTVITDLYIWHCYEELSHHSLVIDMYHAQGGGYLRRLIVIIVATAYSGCFLGLIVFILAISDLFGKRRIKFKHFKSAIKFFWNLRVVLKYYFKFYKFNFDPQEICKDLL